MTSPIARAPLRLRVTDFLIQYWLPIGWLALLTGMFWIGDRSRYHTLFYTGIAVPMLLVLFLSPQRIWPLLRQPIIIWFGVFASYILLSVLWANSGDSPIDFIKRPLNIVLFLCAAFLLASEARERFDAATSLAAYLAALSAALSLVYYFYSGSAERFSGYGALYNPLLSSHVYGFFFIYWLSRWYLSDKAWAWPPLAAMLTLWVLLIVTGSRTPLMACAVSLCWLAVAQWRQRIWLIVLPAVGLSMIFQWLMPVSDLLVRGLSYRPAIWQDAWQQMQDSPWFGMGYSYPQVFHVEGLDFALADTHNIVLGIFFVGGAIALTLWLGFYGYLLRSAWRARSSPAVVLAATLLIFGFMAGQTEGSAFMPRPKEHWFLIWIPMALLVTALRSARSAAAVDSPQVSAGETAITPGAESAKD
jgi:O-antigen ligase